MLCVEDEKMEAVAKAADAFYADVRMCGDDMEIYADRMLLYDLQEAITALQKSAKKLEELK